MKKLLWLIIVILIIATGYWMWQKGATVIPKYSNDQAQTETSPLKTYTDPEGSFSFKYPENFNVTGRESIASSTTGIGWSIKSERPGLVLARVSVPRSYMPQTNFSDANFMVGWSNDPQAIASCVKVENIPGVNVSDEVINGQTYKKFVSRDAGAGNYYDTVVYRAILDGDCYSIEYTIHSTNIGNYDPSQGITEFNLPKIQNELDGIVKSFKFLVNSD